MNFVLETTLQNRKLLYYYLKTIPLEKLNYVPKGFNNNIVWNIGHVVATQQGLVFGSSGCPLLVDSNFVAMYKKGTKPERDATQEEIEELKKIVFLTIEQTIESHKKGELVNFKAYDLSTVKMTLKSAKEAMQFNLYHEGLHLGTIMSLLKVV